MGKIKETVVILAEYPQGKDAVDKQDITLGLAAGSFPDQAEWWARDNEDVFNTIVIPYYNGWKGHELEDAQKIISEIPGKVTLGIMGHSGNKMGGYYISDISKEYGQSEARNNIDTHIKHLADPSEIGAIEEETRDTDWRTKSIAGWYKDIKESNKESISSFINGIESGKVKEVLIGACNMTDRKDASYLSEETGLNISVQSNDSWGTLAVSESKIGDKPSERFFVRGKETVGITFTPDRFANPILKDESERDKYIDTTINALRNGAGWRYTSYGDGEILGKDGFTYREILNKESEYLNKKSTLGDDLIRDFSDYKIDLLKQEFSKQGINEQGWRDFLADAGVKGPSDTIMDKLLIDDDILNIPEFREEQRGTTPPVPMREMDAGDLWEQRSRMSDLYNWGWERVSQPEGGDQRTADMEAARNEAVNIARETIEWSGQDQDVIDVIMKDMQFGDEEFIFED